MLSKLTITLERDRSVNYNSSSLMQGVLMENINPEYADILHNGGINPYSQHLLFNQDEISWEILTMTDEARENIILPMLMSTEPEFRVNHLDIALKVKQKELKDLSMEELMDETYFGDCKPYLTLDFMTPTAFKVDGRYQFYPSVFHIFQSLAKKYDAVSGDTEIFSDQFMKDIQEHLFVVGYNLRSTRFSLEGVKIPAFRGQLVLRSYAPKIFTNLIHMLANFGTFSGVGIKTAMGMGALSIRE